MGKDISKFVLITNMFFMNSVSNIRINYNVISLIETLVEAMFKIPKVVTLTAYIFCWVKNLSMSDLYKIVYSL